MKLELVLVGDEDRVIPGRCAEQSGDVCEAHAEAQPRAPDDEET